VLTTEKNQVDSQLAQRSVIIELPSAILMHRPEGYVLLYFKNSEPTKAQLQKSLVCLEQHFSKLPVLIQTAFITIQPSPFLRLLTHQLQTENKRCIALKYDNVWRVWTFNAMARWSNQHSFIRGFTSKKKAVRWLLKGL